jgi:addiction module HigA family antidote
MNLRNKAARITSPGQVIERELEARGWTQSELAARMGVPLKDIETITLEQAPIAPGIAERLATALGTSSEFWTNLDTKYWRTVNVSLLVSRLAWLVKQLLPLRYDSTFAVDGQYHRCTWRMWLGRCFNVRYSE